MIFFKKKARSQPEKILEEGWQFYHRPTELEPVGTVFRIDKDRRRYIVDTLDVQSSKGQEVSGRLESQINVGAGILSRLLGVGPQADASANVAEKVVFELEDPEREITTDISLRNVLKAFLSSLEYRADNRYFIIRECRWASAMIYRLSKERVLALGGEATLSEMLNIGGSLKTVSENLYEINCGFSSPMRVMFLPEEIRPISAGLGGMAPELGCVAVTEPLVWRD